MTAAFKLLDSAVENGCRNYLMTNLHESYLAGHGFDLTTPRLKTDERSAALPAVPPDPVNSVHVCIYVCVLKCVRA